jgi:hypothetical protein
VLTSADGAAHGAQNPEDHTDNDQDPPMVSKMGIAATNPMTTSTIPRMIN